MKRDIDYLLKHFRKEQISGRLHVSTRTLDRWRMGESEAPRLQRERIHRMAENLRNKLEDKS